MERFKVLRLTDRLLKLSLMLLMLCTYVVGIHPMQANAAGGDEQYEWVAVGNEGFSYGEITDANVFVYNGNVFVAYKENLEDVDDEVHNKATVMAYNPIAGGWIGPQGFTAGKATHISMFMLNHIIYVGFADATQGDKATVMKYTSDQVGWEIVGQAGFSSSFAGQPSMYVDNGVPYLAYRDASEDNGLTVMKYVYADEEWIPVGEKGFTNSNAILPNLIVKDGTAYVSYSDSENSNKGTVMKFSELNNEWVPLGMQGFTEGAAGYPSMDIYNDTVYVAFQDGTPDLGNKATVMKYDLQTEGPWEPVGQSGFSSGEVRYTTLDIDDAGILYVAYRDKAVSNKAVVMKYEADEWQSVGESGVSQGIITTLDLHVYNGTPYVIYNDAGHGSKATVKKYSTVVQPPVPTLANSGVNMVIASDKEITLGETIVLTATGDRQTADGIVVGDERYVPISWESDENKSGVFSLIEDEYTSSYTPSAVGSHTISSTFQKQLWDGTIWESAGPDQLSVKLNYLDVNSSGTTPGPGPGPDPDPEPEPEPEAKPEVTPTPPSDNLVEILVNGKVEHAGTAKKSQRDDQSVTTIVIDEKKLAEKLESEGQRSVITVPVSLSSDVIIAELTGQMIKSMEDKMAVLEVKTNLATYTLPALQLDIDSISKQLGTTVNLENITIHIEIAESSEQQIQIVKNAADDGTFTIVSPPLEFTIKATYGDSSIEISTFKAYVERMIPLPDNIDPSKITTGIVVEPDGTVRHVPTKIIVIDGKYYAQINSLTNSAYTVVWHPLEFSDVESHWAKDVINNMASRMVVKGFEDGNFNPDQSITRAEFAAIVVRGLGLKLEQAASPFSDVAVTDWYNSAIYTAYSYGLISGFEDGSFRPNESISRAQAMSIIATAMTITGLKDKLAHLDADALLQAFIDSEDVADWASKSVVDTLQAGIVSGRIGGKLAPNAAITRAEVAIMIQLLLQKSNLI